MCIADDLVIPAVKDPDLYDQIIDEIVNGIRVSDATGVLYFGSSMQGMRSSLSQLIYSLLRFFLCFGSKYIIALKAIIPLHHQILELTATNIIMGYVQTTSKSNYNSLPS